ncbi:Myb/SANT-like DNA-binding domain protein [Arachis hypogaea]|nr:Myb/SANT-like DNA-binding domain protein [Arachis hypogaea]
MGTAGSEFGWNDKDKMIVSHLNATGLYNKLFSHFEELGIAFGRDRAQGGNAENVTQAVATMEAEREATLSDRQEPPTPGVPAAPGASAAPSSSTAPSASYIERNKKKEGAKHEKEGAERRMKLMTLLRDAPGLSGDDRMTAGLSILRDNSLIDMVFQLQPGELLLFLKKLL